MGYLLLIGAAWLGWRTVVLLVRLAHRSAAFQRIAQGSGLLVDLMAALGARALVADSGIMPGMRVLVIGELSAACVRELERRLGGEGRLTRRGMGEGLPSPSPDEAGFDFIWLSSGLERLPDPPAGLVRLHALLPPGGRIAVTEVFHEEGAPDRGGLVALLEEAGFIEVEHEDGIGHHTGKGRKAPA
jgi:SAM-dependent methyltransferase